MTRGARPLSVAVVGAGPAGIYAAGLLTELAPGTRVDVVERLPTPYGLVRYGVSPDHPKIRRIIDSLHGMLEHPDVRLLANVEVGTDVTIDELRSVYDAVVVATGAQRDARLDVPGVDLPGSFGAADVVSWYDSHPEVAREWPLHAESVAVVGAGNVALDVTRMLIRHARTLERTDLSENVRRGLTASAVRDIHVFARRGPVDVRFSPGELRELGEQEDVDVVVDPAQIVRDEHTERMVRQLAPKRQVLRTFERWAAVPAADRRASRRVHLHFHRAPAAILGTDRVEALRTERTAPDGFGHAEPTGEVEDHPVQAVYRAVGYVGSPVPGVPFDPVRHVVPHTRGACSTATASPCPASTRPAGSSGVRSGSSVPPGRTPRRPWRRCSPPTPGSGGPGPGPRTRSCAGGACRSWTGRDGCASTRPSSGSVRRRAGSGPRSWTGPSSSRSAPG
ncbi:FAD-dependent oxidoreductase [Isoptericola sp. MSP01]|uniref:ferredoxin--NADP(+) reductase n=1 Tax=Isoptericola haloaureus TaxID=1542902 RepID=A0ABU7Z408_9MICO